MTSVAKTLEEKARELAKGLEERAKPRGVLLMLELEIALTIEHIDRLRALHQKLERSLLRSECYVGSDLLKLDTYTPRSFAFRLSARGNLKNKLLKIEVERRHLAAAQEQELGTLHDRLLSLIGKHRLLRGRE